MSAWEHDVEARQVSVRDRISEECAQRHWVSVAAQGRERVALVRQGWAHCGIVERVFEVEVGEGAETISVGRADDCVCGLACG